MNADIIIVYNAYMRGFYEGKNNKYADPDAEARKLIKALYSKGEYEGTLRFIKKNIDFKGD